MKTLHYHIGSERCGSTFIQTVFNDAGLRENMAGAYSCVYDVDAYLALNELAPEIAADDPRLEDIRRRHFALHLDADHDQVFTTQEALLGLTHAPGRPNRCREMCRVIDILAKGFETNLIIVLRRQDTFIESLYNQTIKRGETRDFDTFRGALPLDNYRWDRVVDVFADHFGADRVTVVPFEKRVLESAGHGNFVNGVFAAMGMSIKLRMETAPTINPSLSPRVLEIERLANRLLTPVEAHALADWFENNIPKRPEDDHGLFSAVDRAALIERYRESNARLFAEYLPDYDPEDYLDGDATGRGP